MKPAKGVGRGKYSYLLYNNNKIMLRSTYEFIYALYLLYNGCDFEYETIRVTYDDKTYISDFLVGNKIVEIKGNYNSSYKNQKLAFENAGYIYEIKFWAGIKPCYDFIKERIDIDSILDDITKCYNNKDYYVYEFSLLAQ